MNYTPRFLAVMITLGLLASTSAFAYDREDVEAMTTAKITLEQAIKTALQKHEGSHAIKAEIDVHKGQSRYEVKVVTDKKMVYSIYIDPQNGEVLRDRQDFDD